MTSWKDWHRAYQLGKEPGKYGTGECKRCKATFEKKTRNQKYCTTEEEKLARLERRRRKELHHVVA